MALLDWIRRRREGAELKALSNKYGHECIGAPGAAVRHYEKLTEARKETAPEPKSDNQKTIKRPSPSWER